jgi:hypothetical protein
MQVKSLVEPRKHSDNAGSKAESNIHDQPIFHAAGRNKAFKQLCAIKCRSQCHMFSIRAAV